MFGGTQSKISTHAGIVLQSSRCIAANISILPTVERSPIVLIPVLFLQNVRRINIITCHRVILRSAHFKFFVT